ncbi:MAG TPA: glutathione S-transferase family protein [Xanthobacteraceae bacterium]|nr:glutathione S-transferase family protein [Xanthobacteraceae bacterium]
MTNRRLYDLAGAEPERRFSPYCWRTRLALAHKGLAVETVPWRFTEKAEIAASGQGLVPVLVDGDKWISDSWTIANYLEDTYPDAPSLFGGPAARSLTRYYSAFADSLVAAMFPFIALDILHHVADKDRDYFRESREKRVGKTLEAFVADRDSKLAAFRGSLAPLRTALKSQPFLGGAEPLYADYALFGPFQWARCISPFALLEEGDPVKLWRDKLLERFGGLARNAPAYDV